MSSQSDDGMPFSLAGTQQHFRLLELPPALLELLCSPSPPALSIKSEAVQAGKPSHIVLCTPTETFQLRQVHTSNSVFITQPASSGGSLASGVSAVATCSAFLETSSSCPPISAKEYLENVLPVYHSPSTTSQAYAGGNSLKHGTNKSQIFANIPLSDAECNQAWIELCAFESEDLKASLVPSPSALTAVWRCIMEGTTAESVDLTSMFQPSDLHEHSTDDGWPKELLEAVFVKLALEEDRSDLIRSPERGTVRIDRQMCVRWVGATFLEKELFEDRAKPIDATEFLASWKDALPEAWRNDASWDLLQGDFTRLQASSHSGHNDKNNGTTASNPSTDKKPTARRGKWAEKLKQAKK
ncbi:sister chromatid cohesion protein-like protein Dcc1 [Cryomyces antarcticus]|uniref:Sister chromatid cohesion protein Dcc1 n=1 Tax=Cryomyces antarcticus TaxID=329879 RepID=A0ABR0M5P6_9PEZI|nr:hypothetical protein LTR60_005273 [Cryomyces antarcticus]KAK5009661.1 hypothetical protein LTR39_004888 [Cryomyces antarcticus]KAK5163680.1 hypothetical protein LTR04_002323 [Oleoguttula sp. CCFEE 6159]KAK5283571.1 hypothetical protein LTR16_005419 [Cryomyces antarcticus]